MNRVCKIYFIRHGESLGNARFMFLGHTDLDLSELGYLQADATCKFLADRKIDAVYSSNLLRAYNTAVPNAKLRGIEVVAKEGLREIFCGEWEGMTCTDIEAKYGEIYTVDWPRHFGNFAFPGGESTVGCGERFFAEVESIAKENIGNDILIVAHGAVIRMFWAKICGVSPEDVSEKIPFATNASVSVADFDGEKFIPLDYSIDNHLSDVGITKITY